MKKLLIIALATLFVAGLVDAGFAEDRLKVSGSYRARWDMQDNNADFTDNIDDEANSVNQRFRTQFDIAVAEGISARLRTDFSDGTWGQDFTTARGGNRPNRGTSSAIDIDRAYARWSTELFNLIVGLDYLSFGAEPIGIDQQTTGVKVRFKLPVQIDLVYQMIDESGSTNDDDANGDVNFFGAQAAFKSGAWNAALFAAGIVDDSDADDSPILVGASGGTSFGPLALTGQLEIYFGDVGADDIMGTQLWIEAKYNILPKAHIGIEGLFALGTDDSDEVQYTGLSDWGSWDPTDRGTLSLNTHFSDINGIRNVTGGSSTMNPVFDPSGDSAGVLGINIFGEYAIMDPLTVGANFAYLTPEEDGATTLDSAYSLGIGLRYNWMTNTTLNLGYNLVSVDDDIADTDVSQHLIAMIQLMF
jgi:hypothetical protein